MPSPPPSRMPELSASSAARRTFRLTLSYDGTDFYGWQVQPTLPTIQGTLASAIRDITGESVLPQGSGRTDTGVHAEGQVVSLSLAATIPAGRLLSALNRRLPAAVRVLAVVEGDSGFHARRNVLDKTYEYRIFQRHPGASGPEVICPPHIARYAWDCPWPLDLHRLQASAADIAGTHDLTSFAAADPDRTTRQANAHEDGELRSNVRIIYASSWRVDGDGLLRYTVRGSGFLHHTVRILVGTMVQIGAGRLPAGSIPAILAAKDRAAAGSTAPPQGLHLMHVNYKGDACDNQGKEGATA